MSGTTVNASIPMAGGYGPDMGAALGQGIGNAQQLIGLRQARQKMESENALRNILGAPGAIDATGQPTSDAMKRVMAVDPAAGMKLQQASMVAQEHQLRTDVMKTKAFSEKADTINSSYAPILEDYETSLKGGKMTPAQADAAAQEALSKANEGLMQGGFLGPEEAKRLPTKWNPVEMRQRALGYSGYQDWLKQQNAERRVDQQSKKDEETGWQVVTDPGRLDAQGNPTQFTYNPRTHQSKTLDGQPYQPVNVAKPESVTPAAKAEHDAEVIANANIAAREKELGRPLRPEERSAITQQARLDPKVAAAGQTTTARERAKQDAEKAGIPETPEERMATAAQLATGQPMTQVIPGWGKEAAKAREQARLDALQLIRDQNPQMSAAEAGVELANRGIEYASGKKSSGQLTTMLGATRQGVMQLDFNIDKTKQEMKKLGSTNLSPILNAIARGEERWTGNPAYSSLFYYMNATAMESARILSGGQASIQQLHEGARKEAERWANINMTPASFDAVAKAIADEGHYRVDTFQKAIDEQRIGGKKPASGEPAAAPAAPSIGAKATEEQTRLLPALRNPEDVGRLPEGAFFITPGGIIGQSPKGSGTKATAAAAPESKAPPAEAKPEASAKPTEEKAAPKYIEDKVYVDKQGNRAVYKNGQFVDVP